MKRFGPGAGGRRSVAVLLIALLLFPMFGPTSGEAHQTTDVGVTTLTGSVTVTNSFILSTFPEHFMALIDLSAFVARNFDLPLPSTTQVTTGLEGDWASGATFALPLPIAPRGEINDVGQGAGGDGVQIYSLDVQANLIGDPFLDRDEFEGWSTALTSLQTAFDTGEVVGGRVVIWAPDARQRFPSGFGNDGKLFTADDPVVAIPAGWTVVDLDRQPFAHIRDASVEIPIIEGDAGLKDLSALSFTQAFDLLVADLRLRYPFTAYKGIDWDAIVADIRPSVEFAEQRYDVLAFNVAMMHFTLMLHDAHVAVTPPAQWIYRQYGGGIGLTLGLTDDRRITVRCVSAGLPAAVSGIQPAADILSWNGEDPLSVLDRSPEIFTSSTAHYRNLLRLLWMTRMQPGDAVDLTYRNPGSSEPASAHLEAVADSEGLGGDPCGIDSSDPAEMPVTVEVLPSGIGLIIVNTFSDDAVLMTHAWDWAIQRLNDLDVRALIVDVRGNSGGSGWLATYFAGSFTTEQFVLNSLFVSNEVGDRVEVGETEVKPGPQQWSKPIAVLIDTTCGSACEVFAAAVAHDPAHLIVGRTPTAGAEGGVVPWLLPGGLEFQAPVIAFHNPDGSIFVEGIGVAPNVPVPNTPESLVIASDVDYPLDVAETALQELRS